MRGKGKERRAEGNREGRTQETRSESDAIFWDIDERHASERLDGWEIASSGWRASPFADASPFLPFSFAAAADRYIWVLVCKRF